MHVSVVPLLSALLHTCMSSNWYFSLLFLGIPPLMTSWEHPYDVIRGGNSLSYSNKLWYQQQYLFIYLIYSLFQNFFFVIHASIFLLVRQVNFNYYRTIVAITFNNPYRSAFCLYKYPLLITL